ncbi:MAG TPA: aldo/keto reductase [Acidimicrobiales bacterium]|jgi:aryl-alcohol dehydrogenase-like predicted oxidoreductase|nr:aldo/keto reductase [Acidimicrobiales bacterium]
MTTTEQSTRPVLSSGTFSLGGQEVHRLGFGAMRITGDGIWGEPTDRNECVAVLRRAVELGVDLIDTADSYGPGVSEDFIFEALHPYPDGLFIATKCGLTRQGPGRWLPVGRPEYLRQQCEMSLRRLGVEAIDLYQLHRIDPKVPAEEQFGLMADLLDEGKVRSVGLSQVNVAEIQAAQAVVPVVSVQNRYNLTDRSSEDVLDYCEAEGLGFIPWFPIAAGALGDPGGPVDAVASETGATPSQVALAWLLRRSPVMLPIPGTKSLGHVEENCGAGAVVLTDDQVASLSAAEG